mmetsp:Transcript_8056/g.18256  ORF Transcript_8056/g.18256 Transcript_8056/m.18256 type:complete len:259 (-) Transcript_8056:13-789(-)
MAFSLKSRLKAACLSQLGPQPSFDVVQNSYSTRSSGWLMLSFQSISATTRDPSLSAPRIASPTDFATSADGMTTFSAMTSTDGLSTGFAIVSSPSSTLSMMIAAAAPACCALCTFSTKKQSPRVSSAMTGMFGDVATSCLESGAHPRSSPVGGMTTSPTSVAPYSGTPKSPMAESAVWRIASGEVICSDPVCTLKSAASLTSSTLMMLMMTKKQIIKFKVDEANDFIITTNERVVERNQASKNELLLLSDRTDRSIYP